jgi:hydrogenase maturation protein HypF
MNVASGAIHRQRVLVTGIVQGVGFRPFVLRLAIELGLAGFVGNDSSGAFVEVQGPPELLASFVARLRAEAPPLAAIEQIVVLELEPLGRGSVEGEFCIVASQDAVGPSTLIPPDVAVCEECMAEVLEPEDRRYRYPFANCTNCGPRFTIIRSLPYDRLATSMAGFPMCEACAAEYEDPHDRRFHAQPIACPDCGPQLSFLRQGALLEGSDPALAAVQDSLAAGEIVAVKGLGGYHLACDAGSDEAIARLRERKGRGDKPLALMVPDLETALRLAELDQAESGALSSPARPIVLCRRREGAAVSALVAPGSPLLGAMLPYSPLHHLLFEPVAGSTTPPPEAIVLTSGNLSDDRICFEDADALERLSGIADAFCIHDRPIEVPCDDSVVRVLDGVVVPLRRSRGYAPVPIRLPVEVVPTIGWGGELKTTFCLASGSHAWVSQHIGDLGGYETEQALLAQAESFCRMYGVEPERNAVDRHPGYRSHGLSLERMWPGRTEVQHHHAHLASVMVEHGLDGSSPVIGFAFDGSGYGTDAEGATQVWGGEVLLADYAGFERVGHLAPLPLPGGDAAVRNPCRTAVAYLAACGIGLEHSAAAAACEEIELGVLLQQVERGTGCVPTTSMGRLFDAVASVLGIRHRVSYEAQAAVELEAAAGRGRPTLPLGFGLGSSGVLDPAPVLEGLVEGLAAGSSVEDLACSFHHAVAEAVRDSAERVALASGRFPVALSGGVFQNALLTALARRVLEDSGFEVLTHLVVPPNDGGLSLGQAVLAGYRRS